MVVPIKRVTDKADRDLQPGTVSVSTVPALFVQVRTKLSALLTVIWIAVSGYATCVAPLHVPDAVRVAYSVPS
jgi:hypothetical protein